MEYNRKKISNSTLTSLCQEFIKNNHIDTAKYEQYEVKRGLRNPDGSGVVAGLTMICNVHGYVINEGEKSPVEGRLVYRGIDICDIVGGCSNENRFGFEETVWLLLFGTLPTKEQLKGFCELLSECRELPPYYAEDMIIKSPSPNIMNKLARSVLALYSYDDQADDITMENLLRQSIELIAMMPTIMAYSYQVKRRHYDKESMYFHPMIPGLCTAETILHTIRSNTKYTDEEARLLDLCLMLHAEHGGGNNSTFAARVLASSGTDTYSAISAAIGSLKGPRHGGANIKVMEMLDYIKEGVRDWNDDDEIVAFLTRLINREAGDGSGLIYGMGHAIYTQSDPRAMILKEAAHGLVDKKGLGDEFHLLEKVEKLTPGVFACVKGIDKAMCANVDMYSGLVYRTLGIQEELFTPLFAIARMAGWCAHRIEETMTGARIIRPAYKAIAHSQKYLPMSERS
ncbi:MAG: citrate/2-methylcitrate synthase [Oscillospiraceae bacterium]|nr:citrate/2-methylcitrate synthase [Oscillospiraceae bacterium]